MDRLRDRGRPSIVPPGTHLTMIFLIVAGAAGGLFASAVIYLTAVEHPARVSCESDA